MDAFSHELNTLFVRTYRSIMKVEETMLQSMSGGNLSISEMHIIECIGQDPVNGVSITEIAQDMDVALPSATIAVKKLEKKGYLTKMRDAEDGRRVFVKLTESGRRAEIAHRYFHRQMLKAVCREIKEEDKEALLGVIRSLNDFFETTVKEYPVQSPDTENGGALD